MSATLRSLFAVPVLSTMLALSLAGCLGAEEAAPLPGPAGEAAAGNVDAAVITAGTIASLEEGSRLLLDGSRQVLLFEPAGGAIDYGRIDLVCPNGQQMPMDRWLLDLEERGHPREEITGSEFALSVDRESAARALASGGPSESAAAPSYEPLGEEDVAEPNPECFGCIFCIDGQLVCKYWC